MDKPTLVMIHGLVGSLRYFDPQARLSGATVIAEDLLGYGRQRDFPPDRLTLAAQADHLVDLHRAAERCERPARLVPRLQRGYIRRQ